MANHPILHAFFESLMILVFEALGTGMLTMLFIACTAGGSGMIGLLIGFFILLILSARISGSHYNPVVTMAFMLRKDAGQFNKWLGFLYMIAQAAGAYGGALLIFYCFRCESAALTLFPPYYYIESMVSECLGAFILVLAYLTQTEENFKLTEDAGMTLLVISGAYCVAIALATPGISWIPSPLNPAIALAEITFTTFSGNINEMHGAWQYLALPWLGGLAGVICFEMVFKRASNVVERHDDEEEAEEERREDIVAAE